MILKGFKFQSPEVRKENSKNCRTYIWILVCSQKYRRKIRYLYLISGLQPDLATTSSRRCSLFLHLSMGYHHLGYMFKKILKKTLLRRQRRNKMHDKARLDSARPQLGTILALPTKARMWCLNSLQSIYSSLRDFDPQVIDLFLYENFWKMIFWLVLKLEISYRVMIS